MKYLVAFVVALGIGNVAGHKLAKRYPLHKGMYDSDTD